MNPVNSQDFYVLVFNSMLGGATVSSGITAVTTIATSILVATFLLSVYGAFANGASLSAFGRSLVKFIVVGVVLSQWTAFFNEMVSSSSTIATSIFTVGSGASDIYQSYATNLSNYLQSNAGVMKSIFSAMTGGATFQMLALIVALCLYYLGMLVFAFWYSIWGLLLYMLGPLFIAAYPSGASAPYAKSYIKGLVQWSLWPILYHILGSLITSSNMLTISPDGTITPSSAWAAMEGAGASSASLIVGPYFTAAVTLVFAAMLVMLPKIADHLINLNFGGVAEAAMSAMRTAAGIAVAGAAGAVSGASGAAGGVAKGASGRGGTAAPSSSASTPSPGASLAPPPASSSGATLAPSSSESASSPGASLAPPPASSSGASGGSTSPDGSAGASLAPPAASGSGGASAASSSSGGEGSGGDSTASPPAAGGSGGASGASSSSGGDGSGGESTASPPPASGSGGASGASSSSGGEGSGGDSTASPPPASSRGGGGGAVGGFLRGAAWAAGRAALGRQGIFVAGSMNAPPRPSSGGASTSDDKDSKS